MLKAFARSERLGQWVAVLDQSTDGRYIALTGRWGTSAFSGSNVIGVIKPDGTGLQRIVENLPSQPLIQWLP